VRKLIPYIIPYSLRLTLIICSGSLCLTANAQFSSTNGWIEANVIRGCWPLTVELTHTGVRNSTLFYDFEGNPSDPNSLTGFTGSFNTGETVSFTYTSPQTAPYLIRVVDQTGSPGDRFDFLEVTVLDQVQPIVTVAACANNTVVLNFDLTTDPFDSFDIDFGDGTQTNFVKPTTADATFEHTYAASGNYPITVRGVFSNGDATNCSTNNLTVQTIQSIPVPNLTNITVTSETSLRFDYDALDPLLTYSLQIDDGSGYSNYTSIDPNANASSLEINDNSFDTNNLSYSFRIVATDLCELLEEISSEASSIALNYSLVDITNVFQVQFGWVIRPIGFTQATLFNNQNSLDQTSEPVSNNTYAFNSCVEIGTLYMESTINGIVSRSLELTPFQSQILTLPAPDAPIVELQGSSISISFTATNFPLGEIQISRTSTSNTFESIGTVTNFNAPFTDTSVPPGISEACYTITYTDQCGNLSERSDEVCIELSGNLNFPNAFSPNGDFVNDTFTAGPGVFNNYQLLIYNRWGQVVFQSTNPLDGWDGTISGQPAPPGTYLYKGSYTNADNLTIVRTGTVALIR